MTTLKDLSRYLGLSVTQVSRALNDHSDVSPETKMRVRMAANELNYEPNVLARRLVSGRSGIVGLVWPSIPDPSESWMFTQFVSGLSANFTELGRQFMLHIAKDDSADIDVYRKLVTSRSIDGFVVIQPRIEDARISYLREKGVPFVLHGQTMDTPDYAFYDIDNVRVGYDLTRYLLRQGHREIVFLNGPATMSYAHRRFIGYNRALEEAGQTPRPEFQVSGTMTAEYGMLETVRLFQSSGVKPTAIVAGNTRIAKGIYEALSALGLRVPHDISVVVHDDQLPDTPIEHLPVATSGTVSPLNDAWALLAGMLDSVLLGTPPARLQHIGALAFVDRDSVRSL